MSKVKSKNKYTGVEKNEYSKTDFKRFIAFSVLAILGFLLTFGFQSLPKAKAEQPALDLDFSKFSSSRVIPLGKMPAIEEFLQPLDLQLSTIPNLKVQIENETNSLQRGLDLYQAGNFEEAAQWWRKTADIETDVLKQAVALGNLSLALQQLGYWAEATEAIEESLGRLLALNDENDPDLLRVLAQAFQIRGSLDFSLGNYDRALKFWQDAEEKYQQIGDEDGILRNLLDRFQALQALGLYRRAERTLVEVGEILQTQPDSELKASGFRRLGNLLRLLGKLGDLGTLDVDGCDVAMDNSDLMDLSAGSVLRQSLAVAKELQSLEAIGEAQFSLGNAARALYKRERESDNPNPAQTLAQTALACYQQATASPLQMTQIRAQLNHLSLLLELAEWWQEGEQPAFSPPIQGQIQSQISHWQDLESQIDQLPLGRTAVYARLDLAQSLMQFASQRDDSIRPQSLQLQRADIAEAIAAAVRDARSLRDTRAQSYALGNLGQLYEQTEQWSEAKALTEEALRQAQSTLAEEIAYQWQWQLGRLYRQQGDLEGAIAAYSEAVNSLQRLRSDLVTLDRDIQFDFREKVEPVYRQTVDLLLRSADGWLEAGDGETSQTRLKQARQVIEALQLAELDNFFRDACSDAKPEQLDTIVDRSDTPTAVIYSIILPDRLEVILKLSGVAQLRHYSTAISQNDVKETIKTLRGKLQEPYTFQDVKTLTPTVYKWLIQPAQPDLEQRDIQTLLFVLDGPLRNIPMAALYDGEQYLVEKYAIALTPGLQLLDPRPLPQVQSNVLTSGVTEARPPDFDALPNVKKELETIETIVPSVQLLDGAFTEQNFRNELTAFPFAIVHLATHGQFSSQAEKTFVLTYDDRLDAKELESLLRHRDRDGSEAVELLVLSACETATGDDRSALGLAGVAVRGGARSTLASLWQVNDESTAVLMSEFYRQLHQNEVPLTKAEALRRAQETILKERKQYEHPRYWAPFVLLGNWL